MSGFGLLFWFSSGAVSWGAPFDEEEREEGSDDDHEKEEGNEDEEDK